MLHSVGTVLDQRLTVPYNSKAELYCCFLSWLALERLQYGCPLADICPHFYRRFIQLVTNRSAIPDMGVIHMDLLYVVSSAISCQGDI